MQLLWLPQAVALAGQMYLSWVNYDWIGQFLGKHFFKENKFKFYDSLLYKPVNLSTPNRSISFIKAK